MKTKIKKYFPPLLILVMASAVAAAGEKVAEAELHENVTNAFLNPGKASSLPRVLIIGDSISIGYTDPVRGNLKGVAGVFRPPVNCQHSGYGLAQIKTWLGTGKWDVIHFNFGIWDTHMVDTNGKLVRGVDMSPPTAEIRVRHTPEQYRDNLAKILDVLKGTGARLIWASTTPIMSRTGERFEAIPTLNRTAAELMKSRGVAIDDLYECVLPHVKEWQSPDKVHFNAEGNKHLGKQVADCIQRAIEAKDQ